MNTYIALCNYTPLGMRSFKEKEKGGTGLKFDADSERFAYYMTPHCRYDAVAIFQAVSDEKAEAMILDLNIQNGGHNRCELFKGYETDVCKNQRNLPFHNPQS